MKDRLLQINEKIADIEYFIEKCNGKIMTTLQDRVYRPATRMNLITIAEQFNKLKEENSLEILSKFEKDDLRGINAVRNFMAHDYDSVDDEILEIVLRIHLPKLKTTILTILNEED
jgi:uncharacterized protein with HEPN domain